MELYKQIFLNKKSTIIIASLFILIFLLRAWPFILHGPFGFGYDIGIYKKIFEDTKNFSEIFQSNYDFIPGLLAYLGNKLQITSAFSTYYFYIFISVFLGFAIYKLTKEYFGKIVAIVALALFAVSYAQVLASEFYLFKAILGANFMLFAFYFYAKKSWWFYLFLLFTAFTQLPHILLLGSGILTASIFNLKKDFKYNATALIVLLLSAAILLVFKNHQIANAIYVVLQSIKKDFGFDNNFTGLFMTLRGYLKVGWPILSFSLLGLILTYNQKKILPFQISTTVVILIVFLQLFFQNRFIFEMDLMLIPFAAYAIVWIFAKKPNFKHGFFLLLITLSVSFYYFSTTYASLSKAEIEALKIIENKKDSNFVMVSNDYYSTWPSGFTGKNVIAPAMYNEVWTFDELLKYHNSKPADKAKILIDIAKKYGPFYLFEGRIQYYYSDLSPFSKKITKIFSRDNVKVYKISP